MAPSPRLAQALLAMRKCQPTTAASLEEGLGPSLPSLCSFSLRGSKVSRGWEQALQNPEAGVGLRAGWGVWGGSLIVYPT